MEKNEDSLGKKKLSTVALSSETYARCRDAAYALSGPPHSMTVSSLVEEALQRHLNYLEETFNKGKPFAKWPGKMKRGRPFGS